MTQGCRRRQHGRSTLQRQIYVTTLKVQVGGWGMGSCAPPRHIRWALQSFGGRDLGAGWRSPELSRLWASTVMCVRQPLLAHTALP